MNFLAIFTEATEAKEHLERLGFIVLLILSQWVWDILKARMKILPNWFHNMFKHNLYVTQ